jgi:Na+/H+ antiporter NhaD/arsenite permease-like protein
MVLFVGNPTNVVICEGFAVNNAGFTGYTVLPFLACSLSCFIVLAIQFHHVKYIPRKVNVSGDLDVRAVLLDPVGASVGGAMLGTCLIVIIVVSFFNVQVWMISLPFAVSKFLWDLAWDTCKLRYLKKSASEGENKKKSSMDEEDDDVMLRQLKRRKTHATINVEESDFKHKLKDATANTVVNGAANGHVDTVPNTVLSPANTVIFDEPLPLPSTEGSRSVTLNDTLVSQQNSAAPSNSKPFSSLPLLSSISDLQHRFSTYLSNNFPTFHKALPRLPFALVPFAFSQFILIEGLSRQGWIDIFAEWLVILTKREMFKTIWVVGVFGVLLCNASGTNIGATILLTKIVNSAASSYVPPSSGPEVNITAFLRSAAIALAVASNIGAVSFTFSASLAGLLWRQILSQKKIIVAQRTFARWNLGPVVVMTVVGLAVVSAEMAVLY